LRIFNNKRGLEKGVNFREKTVIKKKKLSLWLIKVFLQHVRGILGFVCWLVVGWLVGFLIFKILLKIKFFYGFSNKKIIFSHYFPKNKDNFFMIDTQFIEKIKVLQTAYQKEKSLRLSLEEKLRRLSENNSHLTTELREKVHYFLEYPFY